MKDYSYYTPIELAIELLKLLEKKEYSKVIDICCGSWNLLKAAKKVLKCEHIVGVDINESVEKYKEGEDEFVLKDGREYALETYQKKKYDLVLSNPPFGLLEDDNRFMLNNLMDERYSKYLTKRYENEMLLANLLLVKRGGYLIAIMPQTFVFGSSNKKIRELIANDFFVDSIVCLPEDTFKKKGIHATAIILEKKKRKNKTKMYKALKNPQWRIQYIRDIDNNLVCEGNWDGRKIESGQEERGYKIFRGNINSRMFETDGKDLVYHCSSNIKNGVWQPSVRKGNFLDKNIKYIKKDDILINRIGKKAGYWVVNKKNGYMVSDCIIVIRDKSGKCIQKLKNNSTKGKLNIPLRGVSTKYITAEDVELILR